MTTVPERNTAQTHERVEVTHQPSGNRATFYEGCSQCAKNREEFERTGHVPFGPRHQAGLSCRSGGHPHCTCDSCF